MKEGLKRGAIIKDLERAGSALVTLERAEEHKKEQSCVVVYFIAHDG